MLLAKVLLMVADPSAAVESVISISTQMPLTIWPA